MRRKLEQNSPAETVPGCTNVQISKSEHRQRPQLVDYLVDFTAVGRFVLMVKPLKLAKWPTVRLLKSMVNSNINPNVIFHIASPTDT